MKYKNNNSKPYESEMTYSQANALNNTYKDNAAFMAQIGTEENPEFLYPEELKESSIKAFNSPEEERNFKVDQYLKELSRRKAENPMADILGGLLFGVAGGGILGSVSQGLNGINIGKTIAKPAWNATKHIGKVMMNPLAAETVAGGAAAATADVYFANEGLKNASNTINKWRNGEFNHQDIPEFVLSTSSAIPLINYSTNVYRNATNAFNAIKRINQAKKISTSDYSDLVRAKAMSNETVNAPGNSEAIVIDPRKNSIYNQQVTGQLSSHSPSKLTKAELEGIPRGERNNVDNGTYLKNWLWRSGKKFGVSQEQFEKSMLKREADFLKAIDGGFIDDSNFYERFADQFGEYTKVQSGYDVQLPIAIRLKKYAKSLPDDMETHPMYQTISSKLTGEVEPPHLSKFRDYLENEFWIPYEAMSTKDLQKILTIRERLVDMGVTGKLKRVPLTHGSAFSFDSFDFPNTLGKWTNNTGAVGPGNYFYANSTSSYGGRRQTFNQPFYVTGIKSVLDDRMALNKGLISDYNGNMRNTPSIIKYPTNGKYAFLRDPLESRSQNGGGIFFDPYFNAPEVAIPKNKGIKSLYPHPDMIVELPDGTFIQKAPDWNDVRFNFKNGGKIYE